LCCAHVGCWAGRSEDYWRGAVALANVGHGCTNWFWNQLDQCQCWPLSRGEVTGAGASCSCQPWLLGCTNWFWNQLDQCQCWPLTRGKVTGAAGQLLLPTLAIEPRVRSRRRGPAALANVGPRRSTGMRSAPGRLACQRWPLDCAGGCWCWRQLLLPMLGHRPP
jgi:hypothetical protein